MNRILWTIQGLLAVHTVAGAVWKAFNPAQSVPSLFDIPREVWMALSGLELLAGLGLVLCAIPRWRVLVQVSSIFLVVEMVFLSVISALAIMPEWNHIAYWLVVALVAGGVAVGRTWGYPLGSTAKKES